MKKKDEKLKIQGYEKKDYLRHYTQPLTKKNNELDLIDEIDSPGGAQGGRIYLKNRQVPYFLKTYPRRFSRFFTPNFFSGCISLNEKIGADLYRFLSGEEYLVPKTKLRIFTNEEIQIVSRYIQSFIQFKDKDIEIIDGQYHVEHNDKLILLQGYVRLSTIAHFLADWDWFSGGDNAGYVIDSNGNAVCVKIDPAMVLKPSHSPVTEIVFFGEEELLKPEYKGMTCQIELLNAIKSIIELSDNDIQYLIKGDDDQRNFSLEEFSKDHNQKYGEIPLREYLDKMAALLITRRDYVTAKYGHYFDLNETNSYEIRN